MKRLGGILAALAVALPLRAQTPAADPQVIVTKAARNYGAVGSLRAEFRMRTEDKRLGNEDSRGSLAQAGKNKFVMRFSDPAGDFYLVDGTYEYTYFRSLTNGQVHQRPLPSLGACGINYIACFLENPAERYDLRYVKSETIDGRVTDAVEMIPHARDLVFRRATVWFDREDGIPRRIDLDKVESRQVVELSRIRKNEPLADSVFRFVKPAGARIITPN